MRYDDACATLPTLARSYARAVRDADLATPVATCPGWDLRKLTRHLGTVYRWAGAIVGGRSVERVDPRTLDLDLPADDSGHADWIERSADGLVEVLGQVAADTPVWAWGADRHARFWPRRLIHETAVHTADAALATGVEPSIDPALAVDAVDELLENLPMAMSFAPHVADLRGDGETIALVCDDVVATWSVVLTADGFSWSRCPLPANVTVQGGAGDLELLLYGRRGRTDRGLFRCTGDVPLLDRWLTSSSL